MIWPILKGLSTYIPGATRVRVKGTGGTNTARYCYSVWLRHLVRAHGIGLCDAVPISVAELGPGDSIGIGLAALISGAQIYYGLDVVEHVSRETNLAVFTRLVDLYKSRADIPAEDEFPEAKPQLESYRFPAERLTNRHLETCLEEKRLGEIARSIASVRGGASMINYVAPWSCEGVIPHDSVDMIFSQATLEHVDDLRFTYSAMRHWLKAGGFLSHQIDFTSHETAHEWNGHWCYSDFTWWLIRGRRRYWLNREPHSAHLRLLHELGFRVLCDERVEKQSKICRARLALRFKNLPAEDLSTSSVFFQAAKVA